MAVNAFVWGFTYEIAKVIDQMALNGVIAPKCWLSFLGRRQDRQLDEKSILKESKFQSPDWMKKYKHLVAKYQHAVPFNAEVYQHVYAKLHLFIDHYSRHDLKLSERSFHYYINQFNLLYSFFYSLFVKENVQLALFGDVPHLGAELIAYEIAKAMNIRTIILVQSLVPNKMYYMEDVNEYGDFNSMVKQENTSYVKLEKKFFADHFYMQNVKKHRFTFFDAAVRAFKKPHRLFEQFTLNYRRYLRVKRYKSNLAKLVAPVDYNKKYVYFPLHLQPEMTTSALGGVFCDQLLALEILSKMLPDDWVIYVKENPKQTEMMRDDTFFERLKLIDNLRVTPLDENTFKLTEHSQFVATITGTAGWESICGGKPALVFGKAWYQNFEGVFKWSPTLKIDDILRCQINHEKLENDYNELIAKSATGVIHRDYSCIVENYDPDENVRRVSEFLTRLILRADDQATLPMQVLQKTA